MPGFGILGVAIAGRLEEERTQNRRSHDKENTRAEPRGGGFRRVGIARRELAIDLHAADQSDDRADSVYQLRRGVEIARYHTRGYLKPYTPNDKI